MSLVHIASLVVLTRSEQLASVHAAVAGLPGAEVAASDPCGKLVVLLDTGDEAALATLIQDINAIHGVLAANLVYHHCEDATTLAQEVDHANHPS